MKFAEIIGQENIKLRLIQSVQEGFIPHARLITGMEGVGALPLALAYARYLMCTNRKETDACGSCPSCVKFNKYAHPDLHFVFPIIKNDKKKKEICDDYLVEWRKQLLEQPYFGLSQWFQRIDAENSQGMIYAKESSEIIRKLTLKTYEAEYKVMIIWLPEKMHESCANKLLKIIEEPPANTVFLLVSEQPDQIIGTIQSRSQRLTVPPIETEILSRVLAEKYTINPDELQFAVHLSGGSYIRAVEAIESASEQELFFELFVTIMRNSWRRDVKNMKAKAESFASLGRERQKAFFAYSQRLLRENYLYRLQQPEINYLNRAEADFSRNFSPYIHERNVIDFMNELALAERHVEQNVNPRLVFFDLSMKIAVLLKR